MEPVLHQVRVEMPNLSQQPHVIAGVAEVLGQRYPIAAQQRRVGEVDDLGRGGIAAQEERDAGRIAERELAVRPLEADALAGQAVQVGRLDDSVAVAADPRIEIIHGNEQHVGSPRRRGGPARAANAGQTGEQCEGYDAEKVFHGTAPIQVRCNSGREGSTLATARQDDSHYTLATVRRVATKTPSD